MSTPWNLGLAPWKPNEGKRKRLLADVVDVLDRWVGSGELPAMTARALLYRLLPLGWTKADEIDVHTLDKTLADEQRQRDALVRAIGGA